MCILGQFPRHQKVIVLLCSYVPLSHSTLSTMYAIALLFLYLICITNMKTIRSLVQEIL